MEANFWKFDHPWTFPEVTRDPTKKLDPIGSAVLTFIGYKHTDRKVKFINRFDQFLKLRLGLDFFVSTKILPTDK